MLDMLLANLHASDSDLRAELSEHLRRVHAAGRADRTLVAKAERVVARDPQSAFTFDSAGYATLKAAGHEWPAGHFETVSIGKLRARVSGPRTGARIRLHGLVGASPFTDVGYLQARSGDDTLFQVASQFNCLESPGPYVTEVSNYFHDPTQGPRASVAAFPAALLRHYMAPDADGGRFVQRTDGRQIDLLAQACGQPVCRNGYFTGEGLDRGAIAKDLEENFDEIGTGVHDGAPVVYGANWDGAVEGSVAVSQVFTSTVAGGSYGGQGILGPHFDGISRRLLYAAYLGTLLAAVSLRRRRVVLTLIGGGVFSNPLATILEAIETAFDEIQPLAANDLDVFINGHSSLAAGAALEITRNRGGVVFSFDQGGLREVLR